MINKIVDEIQNNQQLMECFDSVTAIDDETILFENMTIQAGEITRIVKDNGYKIKDEQDYAIVNGETFEGYRNSIVHKWINDRMPENVSHWSKEGRKIKKELQKKFFAENNLIEIRAIKIKPYSVDIKRIHKEWEEKNKNDLTVGKLIEKLQKLDPDTLVFGVDNEYGEYKISHVSHVHTLRSCPDCHSCGCVRCNTRKMFEKKYVVLE